MTPEWEPGTPLPRDEAERIDMETVPRGAEQGCVERGLGWDRGCQREMERGRGSQGEDGSKEEASG